MAYLAAVFQRLGHRVTCVEDRLPGAADLVVFCPAMATVAIERWVMTRLLARDPAIRILVAGPVAGVLPEAFADLDVTVVKGEAEQLLWKLDEVLERPGAVVQLGQMENLDRLPPADWSPFAPWRFRMPDRFWRFPTALIEQGRGCGQGCEYCGVAAAEGETRLRTAAAIAEEMARGIRGWGFHSFHFRDPQFIQSESQVFRLADQLGRLPAAIQFSIRAAPRSVSRAMLRALKRVGLTCLEFAIEPPDDSGIGQPGQEGAEGDAGGKLIEACRGLGVRTIGGVVVGRPEETEESVRRLIDHACRLNPTFLRFHFLTPYPGTELGRRYGERIDDFRLHRYTGGVPIVRGEHLAPARLQALCAEGRRRFYFRRSYLRANGALLLPILGVLRRRGEAKAEAGQGGPPRPAGAVERGSGRRAWRRDGPHARPGMADRQDGGP